MDASTCSKEADVPNPLILVRNWAVEQVTAIHSVWRPLPVQSSGRR